MIYPFIMAILLLFVPEAAEAARRGSSPTNCVTKLPTERVGYWRYRLVSGKRCWYAPRLGTTTPIQAQRKVLQTLGSQDLSLPQVSVAPQQEVEVVEWDVWNHIDDRMLQKERDLFKDRWLSVYGGPR